MKTFLIIFGIWILIGFISIELDFYWLKNDVNFNFYKKKLPPFKNIKENFIDLKNDIKDIEFFICILGGLITLFIIIGNHIDKKRKKMY
jgi:hypothetical protein